MKYQSVNRKHQSHASTTCIMNVSKQNKQSLPFEHFLVDFLLDFLDSKLKLLYFPFNFKRPLVFLSANPNELLGRFKFAFQFFLKKLKIRNFCWNPLLNPLLAEGREGFWEVEQK